MVETRNPVNRFRDDIRKLIAEIESCMRRRQDDADREYDFQQRAFRERRDQAEQLAATLASGDTGDRWSLRDGDAWRIHESLQLSLDYFRDDADYNPGK